MSVGMAQTVDSEGSSCISFYRSPAKSIVFSRDLLQRLAVSMEAADKKKEELQGEMGLNLGLSLGGCMGGKPKEEAPCSKNFQLRLRKLASETDGKESRGSGSSGFLARGYQQHVLPEVQQEGGPMIQILNQQEMLEQQKRREIHALRRQEARKKREQKQLKKARREGNMPMQTRNGSLVPLQSPSYSPSRMRGSLNLFPSGIGMGSEQRLLESQMSSIRKRDGAAKENELALDRDTNIREKVVRDLCEGGDSQGIERQNSGASQGGDPSASRDFPFPSCPAMAVPYPFVPVLPGNSQCMSVPVGLPFPRPVIPFCTATKGCDASKASVPPFSSVLQPIATRAVLPFQMPISGTSPGGLAGPQQPSHAPGASPGKTSPAGSEHKSRCSQGVTSSDSKSRSTASSALHRLSSASNSQDQALGCCLEVSASSEMEPQCAEEAPEKVPANIAQSALEIPSTAPPHETEVADASSAIKPSQHQSTSKATIHNFDDRRDSEGKLRDMPLVFSACEGPNGKTVSGLLYSYSKEEVSIVCTCHGTFLSPAEFVQHAGGTDLEHPERHIVVHPFHTHQR